MDISSNETTNLIGNQTLKQKTQVTAKIQFQLTENIFLDASGHRLKQSDRNLSWQCYPLSDFREGKFLCVCLVIVHSAKLLYIQKQKEYGWGEGWCRVGQNLKKGVKQYSWGLEHLLGFELGSF